MSERQQESEEEFVRSQQRTSTSFGETTNLGSQTTNPQLARRRELLRLEERSPQTHFPETTNHWKKQKNRTRDRSPTLKPTSTQPKEMQQKITQMSRMTQLPHNGVFPRMSEVSQQSTPQVYTVPELQQRMFSVAGQSRSQPGANGGLTATLPLPISFNIAASQSPMLQTSSSVPSTAIAYTNSLDSLNLNQTYLAYLQQYQLQQMNLQMVPSQLQQLQQLQQIRNSSLAQFAIPTTQNVSLIQPMQVQNLPAMFNVLQTNALPQPSGHESAQRQEVRRGSTSKPNERGVMSSSKLSKLKYRTRPCDSKEGNELQEPQESLSTSDSHHVVLRQKATMDDTDGDIIEVDGSEDGRRQRRRLLTEQRTPNLSSKSRTSSVHSQSQSLSAIRDRFFEQRLSQTQTQTQKDRKSEREKSRRVQLTKLYSDINSLVSAIKGAPQCSDLHRVEILRNVLTVMSKTYGVDVPRHDEEIRRFDISLLEKLELLDPRVISNPMLKANGRFKYDKKMTRNKRKSTKEKERRDTLKLLILTLGKMLRCQNYRDKISVLHAVLKYLGEKVDSSHGEKLKETTKRRPALSSKNSDNNNNREEQETNQESEVAEAETEAEEEEEEEEEEGEGDQTAAAMDLENEVQFTLNQLSGARLKCNSMSGSSSEAED